MDDAMHKLAAELAEATGLEVEDVERALASGDPVLIRLAESHAKLNGSRNEWRANMARHLEAIRA